MNKERKLIKVLRKLSTTYLNRFQKFLESPYFNNKESITTLCRYLIKEIKNDRESLILDDEIHVNIFKDKQLSDVEFRKVFSDALKLFQKFLGVEYFQENIHFRNSLEFRKAQLFSIEDLYTTFSNTNNLLRKKVIEKSSDYYFGQFHIEKTNSNLRSQFEKKNRKVKQFTALNHSEILSYLDKFYILEQLKVLISLESWKRLKKVEFDSQNVEFILSKLTPEFLEQEILIHIYYLLYFTYLEPENTSYYFKAREIISNNKYSIPEEDVVSIYEALLSYCTIKLNAGNSNFSEELFEVYKEVIKYDQRYFGQYFDPSYFRNIVILGLRLGEYDWVEKFIAEFKVRIQPSFRETSYTYALTALSFYKKDFKKVIELLQRVEYEDIWYNVNSKTMLLAAYYELQEFSALDNLLNTFKVYISRERSFSKARKRNYLNYIKYLGKVSNLDSSNKSTVENLKEEIKNTPGVVSKGWLLEKLQEF